MLRTRENLVLLILFSLCVLLFFIRSYLTDLIYTETFSYLQAQQEIQKLSTINNQMKLDVLRITSYTYIAHQAAKMGLTMPANPIYLRE